MSIIITLSGIIITTRGQNYQLLSEKRADFVCQTGYARVENSFATLILIGCRDLKTVSPKDLSEILQAEKGQALTPSALTGIRAAIHRHLTTQPKH